MLLIAVAPAERAHSESPDIATLDTALTAWMSRNGVTAASAAVMRDGLLVKSIGYAGMDPARPARIASLSKAITAVCIARLVDEGRLSFSTPLATALAKTFKKFGEPTDARFKAITIGDLLTHRAGLAREARHTGGYCSSRMRSQNARPL